MTNLEFQLIHKYLSALLSVQCCAVEETGICGVVGNLQDLNLQDLHLPIPSAVSSLKKE